MPGNNQYADTDDIKNYAMLLAQKKYAGKNLRYNIAVDTQKLNQCLILLQKRLSQEDLTSFKHQIKYVEQTEKRTTNGRADNFLRSTAQLREKLLLKYPKIEPHFCKRVMKIGSPSSYRPDNKDKVYWNNGPC